jgi:hypothetical protein
MQIKESIEVPKNSKLHNSIHRGYRYIDKADTWCYSGVTRLRLNAHATKCFDHAHHLFRKLIAENKLEDWDHWRIGIAGGNCSNGDFYAGRVTFIFTKLNKEQDDE